jgi:hypothetical protein
MNYPGHIDNLIDQAYQDRSPIKDRGNNSNLKRIEKIEKELLEEKLLRIVNEFNLTKRG